MSESGTFRTRRDVRFESVMRTKADADAYKLVSLRPRGFMPQNGELFNNLNLICPVQFDSKKYSGSRATQINSISIAVPPHRGAARDRHGRGAGCGGRGWRF
jgi:hypothetical protein